MAGFWLMTFLPKQKPNRAQHPPKKHPKAAAPPVRSAIEKAERITRTPMTQLRKKVAEHLMKAKQETRHADHL